MNWVNLIWKNKDLVLDNISSRSNSILAHGLKSHTEKQYNKFRDLVLRFANVLNPEINNLLKKLSFRSLI